MSLFAALALGAALQAPPEPDVVGLAQISCSPEQGRWSLLGDGGERETRPARSSTYIWSCRSGGRLLVVKSWLVVHGAGTSCHSRTQGSVSAWLDGVKIVSREPFGEYASCSGGGAPALLVASISVRAKGVEVCRQVSREGEGPMSLTCFPAPAGGSVDPAYRAPGPRSEARLRVLLAEDAVCEQVSPRLAFARQGIDGSLDGSAVAGSEGWGHERATGQVRSARFDLDNDGAAETVAWSWHGLTWSGADGRTFQAASLPFVAGGSAPSGAEAATNQPVRLAGRTWLYLRRVPGEGGDADYDLAMQGFGGAATISRGLMALTPDGKSRLVCAWGPEPRPEDAL